MFNIESDDFIASDIKIYENAYHTDNPILINRIYNAEYDDECGYFCKKNDKWFLNTYGYEFVPHHIDMIRHFLTNKRLKEIVYSIGISYSMYDSYIPESI
jgi:hypothetical protein